MQLKIPFICSLKELQLTVVFPFTVMLRPF